MFKAIFEGLAGVVGLMGAIIIIADFFGIKEEVSRVAAAHIDIFIIVTILYISMHWIFVELANYDRKKVFTKRRKDKAGAGPKSGPRK